MWGKNMLKKTNIMFLLIPVFIMFLIQTTISANNSTKKLKFSNYAFNNYSQYGEDGIIQKIFEIINTTSKICVEFGAWDGLHLSNTANLWINHAWKGILIESDPIRFKQLAKNIEPYNCIAINATIGIEGKNSLKNILNQFNIHDQIDLLSIDIDGNDYYILKNLGTLRPRIIICEYNPTLPPTFDIYPEYNNYFGCSVAALIRVAEEHDYKLIALTDTNAFFCVKEEFQKLSIFETTLEKIKIDKYLMYIATSYDGKSIILGKQEKPAYGKICSQYNKKVFLNNCFRIDH